MKYGRLGGNNSTLNKNCFVFKLILFNKTCYKFSITKAQNRNGANLIFCVVLHVKVYKCCFFFLLKISKFGCDISIKLDNLHQNYFFAQNRKVFQSLSQNLEIAQQKTIEIICPQPPKTPKNIGKIFPNTL